MNVNIKSRELLCFEGTNMILCFIPCSASYILLMALDYYCDLIVSTCFSFLAENPYDSIPNFSAADALRLTGIGRNEFIDIMNKCRSKVLDICLCVFVFMVDIIVIQFLNSLYLFKAHVFTIF